MRLSLQIRAATIGLAFIQPVLFPPTAEFQYNLDLLFHNEWLAERKCSKLSGEDRNDITHYTAAEDKHV